MKFTFSSSYLFLFALQVLHFCNAVPELSPIALSPLSTYSDNFASDFKVLKSADSTSFKSLQSIFTLASITNNTISTDIGLTYSKMPDLTKIAISNTLQFSLKKLTNALNVVTASLAGCKPEISYPNKFNISTACFSSDCSKTPVKCQALCLQIAIDELMIALNGAVSSFNLTSDTFARTTWNLPSLPSIITQWSIIQANAASYQNSTTIGPLINRASSRFKQALNSGLSKLESALNSFSSAYKSLVNTVTVAQSSYNQTFNEYTNMILLSATSNAEKSILTDSFTFNGIVVKSSSTQSTINGISIASFVRPAAISVFDKLADLSSTFNVALANFQTSLKTLSVEQQLSLQDLIVSKTKSMYEDFSQQQGTTSTDINQCVASTSIQNSYHSLLKDNFQLAQSSALNLTAHYTNFINTQTNRAIDCFKVACADNVVYSYSSWKLQCVHDTTFTKFCWDDVIPRNVHRCPSAKAESLNACLDEVSSMITSSQPASDMEMILEDTKILFNQLEDYFNDNTIISSANRGSCVYSRIYGSVDRNAVYTNNLFNNLIIG